MRYRVVLDVDTDDPDSTRADLDDAVDAAVNALVDARPGWWVDVETIDNLGT